MYKRKRLVVPPKLSLRPQVGQLAPPTRDNGPRATIAGYTSQLLESLAALAALAH